MTRVVRSGTGAGSLYRRSLKGRAAAELACEGLFRPLAHPLVRGLAALGVPPVAVLLANAATGLAAAALLWCGHLVWAAVLLQAKTLLDNADGQLARATGRITRLGRYLDTECDLAVNAALLAALGHVTGRPVLAGLAFAALVLVLAADYGVERLHREARGAAIVDEAPAGRPAWAAVASARAYAVLLAPLDRAVRGYCAWRVRGRSPEAVLAWHDATTVSVLANLGLSTQLLALGLCLAAGAPDAYLWLAVGCACLLPVLAVRRELVARRAG